MFIYFKQNKEGKHKKGQLAPFFIVIIVIILIAALISVNLGKIARTKTYSGNSSDAAALGAASVLAYAFNYVAKANVYFENNYWRFRNESYYHLSYAWNKIIWSIILTGQARALACSNPCSAVNYVELAIDYLRIFTEEMYLFRNSIIGNFYEWQRGFYKRVRQRVDRIEDNKNDLYNQALVAGYKMSFLNSGTAVKLKSDWQSQFYNWIDSISVSNVVNSKVENFPQPFGENSGPSYWLDGQTRKHYVWGQVKINPINDYEIRHTVMTYWEEMDILNQTIVEADKARGQLYAALAALNNACAYYKCCKLGDPYCCGMFSGWCKVAMERLTEAMEYLNNAYDLSYEAWQGIQIETSCTTTSSTEDEQNLIIAWIDDIDHNHLVQSYTRQLHQGNAVSEEGSDDVTTFSKSRELWLTWYPITHGATEATFNYQDKGEICSVHDGTTCSPVPEYDSAIVDVDFTKDFLSGGLIE